MPCLAGHPPIPGLSHRPRSASACRHSSRRMSPGSFQTARLHWQVRCPPCLLSFRLLLLLLLFPRWHRAPILRPMCIADWETRLEKRTQALDSQESQMSDLLRQLDSREKKLERRGGVRSWGGNTSWLSAPW